MKIDSPTEADWQVFLDLAMAEGWRVPRRELELYRGILAGGAFVLRRQGEPCGFVTAVPHENSGWIGNLLVAARCRGRGYGNLLFDRALEFLRDRGMTSVWLTASQSGRPIYEKKGFQLVGGIERWTLVLDEPPMGTRSGAHGDFGSLCRGDCRIWGESRRSLLIPLARGGEVFSQGETSALLQEGDGMRVLGPWVSETLCPRENRRVLLSALASVPAGTEVVVDLLEGSPLSSLVTAAGFRRRGRSDLMVLGPRAGVDLRPLVALASLGSMG
jgi:GNAT superfamily N-acetyltransferase